MSYAIIKYFYTFRVAKKYEKLFLKHNLCYVDRTAVFREEDGLYTLNVD